MLTAETLSKTGAVSAIETESEQSQQRNQYRKRNSINNIKKYQQQKSASNNNIINYRNSIPTGIVSTT
jgi:hypothetical protein